MVAWIVLLLLVAGEAGGFIWWLRKEFYPVFFSGWAASIYSAILFADFLVAWLVSYLVVQGGSTPLIVLTVLSGAVVLIVLVMTFFFKWVVSGDMTDPSR